MTAEGNWYKVTTVDGEVEMRCIKHTDEGRILESPQGFLDIDWMEWMDQCSLGRIRQLDDFTGI